LIRAEDMNIYYVNVRMGGVKDNIVFTVLAYDVEDAKQKTVYSNDVKYRNIIEVN